MGGRGDGLGLEASRWKALLVGGSLVVGGVVLLAIAWLSFGGRLPRNGSVGIRTGATMASEAAWRRAHLAAAPWTMAQGVVLGAGGAWVLVRRPSERATAVATVAVVVVLGVLVAVAVVVATTAAEAAPG